MPELLGLVLFVLLVGACSPQPEAARYTVDEYRRDDFLRHAQVARCRQDPGTLRNNPDCINAEAAASLEDRTRLRDAPPVGLGEKKADELPKEE
jgi:hypothetical protein